jgi:hypothetical protein
MDRTTPFEGKLVWIPIASGRHPEEEEHLAYWNPCDGCEFGYWDESDGFMYGHPFTRTHANGRPGREDSTPINGGETHYAVLNGPEPRHDISVNWKLCRGDYKSPSDVSCEIAERLAETTGLDLFHCWKVLDQCEGDAARAEAELKATQGAN